MSLNGKFDWDDERDCRAWQDAQDQKQAWQDANRSLDDEEGRRGHGPGRGRTAAGMNKRHITVENGLLEPGTTDLPCTR